jgi:peptidoglycan/xylan/chitin deacetylase (PgdA/CDA1 family)
MIAERSSVVDLGEAAPGSGRGPGRRWPRILMYHAIARVPEDPNRICVSPGRFEAQMRYLKRRGLRGVSVKTLMRPAGSGRAERFVGITFDDAYENFLHAAVPILQKYGFSATVFAVGGMLGEVNAWDERPRMRLLGVEGLREAARRGMEVASHGMSHIRLASVGEARLSEEVVQSRKVLAELLDQEVVGFCYPYGSVDGAAARAAREAGYSYACACWTRVENSLYDLPRPPVWEMDGPLLLAAKLRLFPAYFDALDLPVQSALDKTGRMVHGGAKYLMRAAKR